jgi:hypothetical protein
MRALVLALATVLAGCSAAAEPAAVVVGPAGQPLHGSAPAQPLGLPEFAVADHLGQARDGRDLLGRPHVLWFYPMAGTPG